MLHATISCRYILFRIKSLQEFWFLLSLIWDETSNSCSFLDPGLFRRVFFNLFSPATWLLSLAFLEMQYCCMDRNQIRVFCSLVFNGWEGKIYHCFYNSLYKNSWNKKALSSTSSTESNVGMFCCFSSNRIYEALNVVKAYWKHIKGFCDFVFQPRCKGPSWTLSKGL